jgi:transcription termination factor NusB
MIKENLFDLTPEQIDMSKNIYNGKIIKCLVAPYHSYNQLEKEVTYTKNTFLFPEREMTSAQCSGLISMLVKSPSQDEFLVITSNQNIILDMIDGNVRILTEKGDIVDCPTKTFMANIHDIRYYVLENKDHQLSDEEKSEGNKVIQNLIGLVQEGSEMTKAEYDDLVTKIEMVGEDIIRRKLLQMASYNITITGYSNVDAEIERVQKEIDRLEKLKSGR